MEPQKKQQQDLLDTNLDLFGNISLASPNNGKPENQINAISSSQAGANSQYKPPMPIDLEASSQQQQQQQSSNMIMQQQQRVINQKTLNEPVKDTIMRDLQMIFNKIKYVMTLQITKNQNQENQLRDWDLWGPLLLCLVLALSLSLSSINNSDLIFETIFVVVWIGSGFVTLNAKLLKGKISFFQSVCVLGYCTCPIAIVSFIISIIHIFPSFLVFFLLVGSLCWSTYASIGFLSALVSEDKKWLVVYPLCLFYLFLSWLSFITLT